MDIQYIQKKGGKIKIEYTTKISLTLFKYHFDKMYTVCFYDNGGEILWRRKYYEDDCEYKFTETLFNELAHTYEIRKQSKIESDIEKYI